MGELSDGYGRRKVLLLCVFELALSDLLMALGEMVPSLALLLLGRGLSGLIAFAACYRSDTPSWARPSGVRSSAVARPVKSTSK